VGQVVRGFVSSHDWSDYVDLIEGEPDWKELKALCLVCYQTFTIGRVMHSNEPVQLPDGTLTDPDTWRHEAGRASIGKGKRRKWRCEMCGADTQHVAVR
jgi:hypothetical protein